MPRNISYLVCEGNPVKLSKSCHGEISQGIRGGLSDRMLNESLEIFLNESVEESFEGIYGGFVKGP